MRNQKGITLASLTIYIIIIMIAIITLTTITSYFQKNVKDFNTKSAYDIEFDKFNLYFVEEVKKTGNTVIEPTEETSESTKIKFSLSNVYEFKEDNNAIYLNDSIKIAENIDECKFLWKTENENQIISVYIKVGETERTTDYTINKEDNNKTNYIYGYKNAEGKSSIVLENAENTNLADYEIYGNSIQNGTPSPDEPAEIKSVGDKTINMIDYKKIRDTTSNGVTFINNNDGTFTANGDLTLALSSLSFANGIDFTDIKQGIEYYASCENELSTADKRYYFFAIIKNISTGSVRYFSSNNTKKTFTLSDEEEVTSLELRIYAPTGELFSVENEVFKPIFCEASECINYEPYGYKIPIKVSNENGTEVKMTNIYLDEPLRKVGDYADYIDFQNQKVVRQIKKTTINSLSFQTYSALNNYYRYETITLQDKLFTESQSTNVLSNVLQTVNYNKTTVNNSIAERSNYNLLRILSSEYSTLEELENAIGEEEVYYVLSSPIEKSIDLPEISTVKGTTIIEICSEIEPSLTNITYYSN